MNEHDIGNARARSRGAVLSALVLAAAAGLAHGQVAGSTELAVASARSG